jgi:hypothetical protein
MAKFRYHPWFLLAGPTMALIIFSVSRELFPDWNKLAGTLIALVVLVVVSLFGFLANLFQVAEVPPEQTTSQTITTIRFSPW